MGGIVKLALRSSYPEDQMSSGAQKNAVAKLAGTGRVGGNKSFQKPVDSSRRENNNGSLVVGPCTVFPKSYSLIAKPRSNPTTIAKATVAARRFRVPNVAIRSSH